MFLVFFGFKVFTFFLYFYQLSKNIYAPFLIYYSYSMLLPTVLFSVVMSAEIWIAYYYNKYYTKNLLADGFHVMEGDEYSAAILKNYTYLPYTGEEIVDNDKIERYLNFAEQVRKTERSKAIAFFVIVPITYIILLIMLSSATYSYIR